MLVPVGVVCRVQTIYLLIKTCFFTSPYSVLAPFRTNFLTDLSYQSQSFVSVDSSPIAACGIGTGIDSVHTIDIHKHSFLLEVWVSLNGIGNLAAL